MAVLTGPRLPSPGSGNPWAAAEAQAGLNRQSAIDTMRIANPNVVTPEGSVEFLGTPGVDFTRVERLTPRGKQAHDLTEAGRVAGAQQGLGRLLDFGGRRAPFDLAGLGRLGRVLNADQLPDVIGLDDPTIAAVERSTFDRGRRLLDPVLAEDRDRLDTQLANEGIARDSVAALRARGTMDRRHQGFLADLADRAVTAGRAEHGRLFGAGLARRGLEGQLQGQAFGQAEGQRRTNFDLERLARTQELNEAISMLGLGTPQRPEFQPTALSQVQAPNYLGALSADRSLDLQRSTQNKSFLSGLLGLAAPIVGSMIGGPVGGAVGGAVSGLTGRAGVPSFNPAENYYGTRGG